MAETKKYLHTLDVSRNKVANLLLNPLTTLQRTTIGGTLGLTDQGYAAFDTTTNELYFWDGTTWTLSSGLTTWGSITGTITAQTDLINYLTSNYYPLSSNPAGYLTSASISGMVTGTGVATRVAFWDTTSSISSNSNLYWDNVNNRLGIGTATPSKALEVTSDAIINSALIGVGPNSGSLFPNTNIVFGNTALNANTTGYYNVAFGTNALSLNTSGYANTAIGYDALKVNVITRTNVALGWAALQNFIGDGSVNGGNLAIGPLALQALTTGTYNTAIGYASNYQNPLGKFNLSMGYTSMRYTTGGDYNTVIGTLAGRYYSTGTSQLTTFNNTTLIGVDTRPLANNGTNEVVIGYGAIGNGSNTSTIGNSLTVSTNLFGSLGFGSTPNYGTTGQVLVSQGSGVAPIWATPTTGTITGTGIATRVAFWDGTSSLSSNANLYWDNVNSYLGISNTIPIAPIDLGSGTGTAGSINKIALYSSPLYGTYGFGISPAQLDYVSANNHVFYSNSPSTVELFRIGGTGTLTASSLTGSGTRMVVSNSIGELSTQTIPSFTSPLTTKGDIYVRDASTDTRLPVGLDTQILLADSTQPTGLKWGTNTAPTPLGYYAQYFSYISQYATTNLVGNAMFFETPDLSNGITVVSNGGSPPNSLTKITFANTGKYNLQFSSQFENTSNAPQDVYIWLRKNGITPAADVLGSTGVVGLEPRKSPLDPYHTIITWNFLLDVIAGDFYQIVWATTEVTAVNIQYYIAQPGYPSTVSTLFTVTQQSGIMAGTGVTNVSASMVTPAQTVSVTNPTTTPAISIDDSNLLHDKFMVRQYAYLLPTDGATYSTQRVVAANLLTTGTVSGLNENPAGLLYTTAAAVGSVTARYGSPFGGSGMLSANFTFDYVSRFRITTNNGAQRFFSGISSLYSSSAPTNVEPTSLLNIIGVAKLQATANLYFVWNDGTGTASSLDLGSGFLGTDTASTYKLRIYKTFGVAAINLELTKIVNSTGVVTTTSTTITSDYNTGVNYYPVTWMGNNTGASGAVSFKDYGCQLVKNNFISA